jgi:hypothetical protein
MNNKSVSLKMPVQFVEVDAISPLISKMTVKIMYPGKNRNSSYFSKEVIEEMAKSLPNTPIVGEWDEYENDFLGHGQETKIDDKGNVKTVRKTIPIGVVPSDAKIWWETFLDNGKTERDYLCSEAYIWTGRYPEAKKMVERGKNNQSMELDPVTIKGKWAQLDKKGPEYFIVEEAHFSALCVLGESVEPAFEGASFKNQDPVLYSLLKNEERKQEFDKEVKQLVFELEQALVEYKPKKTDFPKKGDDKAITLRNSEWQVFDPDFAAMIKEKYPEIWNLGGNIRGNSQYRKLIKAVGKAEDDLTPTLKDAIKLREAWVARHKGDFRIAGVIAQIKWLAVGTRGQAYMKDLVKEEIKKREARKVKNYEATSELVTKLKDEIKKLSNMADQFEDNKNIESTDDLDLIITELNKILDMMKAEKSVPLISDPELQNYTQKEELVLMQEEKELFAEVEEKEEEELDEVNSEEAPETDMAEEVIEEEEEEDKEEASALEEIKTMLKHLVDAQGATKSAVEAEETYAPVIGKEEAPRVDAEAELKKVQEDLQYKVEEAAALKMELEAVKAALAEMEKKEKMALVEKFSSLSEDFLNDIKSKLDSYSLDQLEGKLAVEALRSTKKEESVATYSFIETSSAPSWIAALEKTKK